MNYYTSISVCPVNGGQMSRDDVMSMGGVCPRCGHDSNSTISHEKKVVGTWVYLNGKAWWEFWIKPTWEPKEADTQKKRRD